jgi:hypothetical protein
VAPRAIGPELRFVHVDVTGGAERLCAGERQVLVAARAFRCQVLTFQREAGRRVIEARVCAHCPGIGGVT